MTELVIPLTVPEGRRRTITDIDRTPHEIQRCEDNGSAVPADTAWPSPRPAPAKARIEIEILVHAFENAPAIRLRSLSFLRN